MSQVVKMIMVATALSLVSAPAFAAKKTKTEKHTAATAASSSSEDTSSHFYSNPSGSIKWGAGFAAWENISNVPAAITLVMKFNDKFLLQPVFGINGTQGTFTFGVGSLAKYTVAESGNAGFHVGGGVIFGKVAAGTDSVFGVGLAGLGGFHFSVPGASQVMVHLDGGPQLTIVDGNANFMTKALSAALGLSVVYMF